MQKADLCKRSYFRKFLNDGEVFGINGPIWGSFDCENSCGVDVGFPILYIWDHTFKQWDFKPLLDYPHPYPSEAKGICSVAVETIGYVFSRRRQDAAAIHRDHGTLQPCDIYLLAEAAKHLFWRQLSACHSPSGLWSNTIDGFLCNHSTQSERNWMGFQNFFTPFRTAICGFVVDFAVDCKASLCAREYEIRQQFTCASVNSLEILQSEQTFSSVVFHFIKNKKPREDHGNLLSGPQVGKNTCSIGKTTCPSCGSRFKNAAFKKIHSVARHVSIRFPGFTYTCLKLKDPILDVKLSMTEDTARYLDAIVLWTHNGSHFNLLMWVPFTDSLGARQGWYLFEGMEDRKTGNGNFKPVLNAVFLGEDNFGKFSLKFNEITECFYSQYDDERSRPQLNTDIKISTSGIKYETERAKTVRFNKWSKKNAQKQEKQQAQKRKQVPAKAAKKDVRAKSKAPTGEGAPQPRAHVIDHEDVFLTKGKTILKLVSKGSKIRPR